MSSKGAPMARSAKLSLLKSPAASAAPKKSLASATPITPALPWSHCWLPVAVSLPAEP